MDENSSVIHNTFKRDKWMKILLLHHQKQTVVENMC